MEEAICVSVQDQTQTGEARRAAIELATRLAFDETETGNVGLVVTEAAKNLLKHAGGGDILLSAAKSEGAPVVEVLAIDRGPGIANLTRSFEDGYSTAGTPGTGLGAISRLSTFYDIYSQPNGGTALLAQVRKRSRPAPRDRFVIGVVSIPKAGEPVCGDAWSFTELPSGGRFALADGLGHGLLAADAARLAVRTSRDHPGERGVALVERIHQALRPTRGAAVSVAEIDRGQRVLKYTGVGNIAGFVVSGDGTVRGMVSHSGTAGHHAPRIVEFAYPWDPSSSLILHSDGLSHLLLDKYPGLLNRHPSVVAGVLYRDFTRGRDDSTVVVAREAPAAA